IAATGVCRAADPGDRASARDLFDHAYAAARWTMADRPRRRLVAPTVCPRGCVRLQRFGGAARGRGRGISLRSPERVARTRYGGGIFAALRNSNLSDA